MDATGLTSGTVYPTLEKLEDQGFLRSRWEDPYVARRERRPARRYFRLTATGAEALEAAMSRHKMFRPVPGLAEKAKSGA